MAVDHIRYDILAQEALRGVVRTVLADAAKNGLPGEHHFYISFDTRAEGVRLSPRMLAQYPEEMTIVLQHQFWDLMVTEDGFEVGLSFGGVPERLAVPFAAIKGFSIRRCSSACNSRRSSEAGEATPKRAGRNAQRAVAGKAAERAAGGAQSATRASGLRRRARARQSDRRQPAPPTIPTSRRAAARWCGSTASARSDDETATAAIARYPVRCRPADSSAEP